MPELPEVETIRQSLRLGGPENPPLLDSVIVSTQVYWERSLATPSVTEFQTRIQGQRIAEIGRRGKFLDFQLSQDHLLIHLRMSGDLQIESIITPVHQHHRLTLDLISETGRMRLAFNDPRKFGRVWLLTDPSEVLGSLGPEPLDPDFTPQDFYQALTARRRQLKPLLLDQTFLAGLGNIYADEALHLARLHPLSLSNLLTPLQAEDLWRSIRQTLQEGIRSNGASIDWVYRGGDFQNHFRVYQRTGEPCPNCGAAIQRIVVGQRSTHFCPRCQLKPEYNR
jgi:formamidopyrimidine-DNA glycosylase